MASKEGFGLRRALLVVLLAALVLAGCARGTPKAVTPETEYDFGDVPTTDDMSQVRLKEFVIINDGTANLRLSDVQVKLLEGC